MHVRFLISHIGLVKLLSDIKHYPYGVFKRVCEHPDLNSIKEFIQLSSTLIAGKETIHISIFKNKYSIVLTVGFSKNPH